MGAESNELPGRHGSMCAPGSEIVCCNYVHASIQPVALYLCDGVTQKRYTAKQMSSYKVKLPGVGECCSC